MPPFDNLILHITQVILESTQVYERMSTVNTSWKPPKLSISDQTLSFRPMTSPENTTIR